MHLKLKHTVRIGGTPYRAATVIDTTAEGTKLSDTEARVLILRGAAEEAKAPAAAAAPAAPAPAAKPAPEVVKIDPVIDTKKDEPAKQPEAKPFVDRNHDGKPDKTSGKK